MNIDLESCFIGFLIGFSLYLILNEVFNIEGATNQADKVSCENPPPNTCPEGKKTPCLDTAGVWACEVNEYDCRGPTQVWCDPPSPGPAQNKNKCYKKPNECKEIIKQKINKSGSLFGDCYIWAGGGAKIQDLKPRTNNLKNLPKDKESNSFKTRDTPYYTQYYPYITTLLKTNKGDLDLSRRTIFTIPKNKKMPPGGWPILINFEFMSNDGYSLWYETEQEIPGGLGKDMKKDSEFNIVEYYNTLKLCVYNGIAIIHLSQLNYDVYPSYECGKGKSNKSPFSSSDYGGICWNDGDNYLKYYLDQIFNLIKENNIDDFKKLIPDISDDIKFDYNKISIIGYSGPAHMVSRCINDFPFTITDKGYCYPDIKSCIMIGGGSLHCYEDGGDGKCPTNVTEPNYDNGNICWDNHPPVLLCQYKDDYDADARASIHYFNILHRKGVEVYRLSKNSWNHALPKCNKISSPDVCNNFLLKYMKN